MQPSDEQEQQAVTVSIPDAPIISDGHIHKWVAQGNFIHCEAGTINHGLPYDHLKQRLVGTDEAGNPIMRTINLTTTDNTV